MTALVLGKCLEQVTNDEKNKTTTEWGECTAVVLLPLSGSLNPISHITTMVVPFAPPMA
jgi:hypothetical protein